jgi:ABC-type molybdate transport system permease subunit
VETLSYREAHVLSLVLLVFCFAVLLVVFAVNRRGGSRVG